MSGSWWRRNYGSADEQARYLIQDSGLTSEHIIEFTKYTEAILKPRETKAQFIIGCSLSVGAIIGLVLCTYIVTDGFTHQKFNNDLKTGSLSAITAILGFLAGKAGKDG